MFAATRQKKPQAAALAISFGRREHGLTEPLEYKAFEKRFVAAHDTHARDVELGLLGYDGGIGAEGSACGLHRAAAQIEQSHHLDGVGA